MFEMFLNSATLFVQGRLFQDLTSVAKQAGIGIAIALFLALFLAILGLSLWPVIIIASLVSGAVQPYLFKDLKYR